jgi:hypothetical protein
MSIRPYALILPLLITCHAFAQRPDPASPLISRITPTPPGALQAFHDAGMSPHEHQLTDAEKKQIARILAALPPLHKKVLAEHLEGISFLDDMPNTALTSLVGPDDTFRVYHITFRAAILHQDVSEWLTEKERTCFESGDPHLNISVEAGTLDAMLYVLLHETTHVVDGALGLLAVDGVDPRPGQEPFARNFTQGIWLDRTTLAPSFRDSLLLTNHFRRGKPFPPALSVQVYTTLRQTPFVSLYSTSSRHEDLAELLTVYHFVYKLHQPFGFIVSRDDKPVFTYEPMSSDKVKARTGLLGFFYHQDLKPRFN